MTEEKQLCSTYVHVGEKVFEVLETVEQIKEFVYDKFIEGDTFIQLHFLEGDELFIRKNQMIAFYKSE